MSDNISAQSEAKHTAGKLAYRHKDYDSFADLARSQEEDKPKTRIEFIPIYIDKSTSSGSEICRIVHDPADGFDLIEDRSEHEANAARLVHCWNNFDAVVEALADALSASDPFSEVDLRPARAALANALAIAKDGAK